jgi:hypothetical protein
MNRHVVNFKISGENQHWNRRLTFWRNFPQWTLWGTSGDFSSPGTAHPLLVAAIWTGGSSSDILTSNSAGRGHEEASTHRLSN